MKKSIFILSLLVTWVVDLACQSDTIYTIDYEEENNYNEGVHINFLNIGVGAMTPQNAFKNKVSENLFQFNVSLFRQIKKYKPFFAGFEFAYAEIDVFSSDVEYVFDDGSVEFLPDNVRSDIKQFNLIGRYYLPISFWVIDPFAEFGYNAQWYSTKSTIDLGNDESDQKYVKNDLVGQYGFAAGLNFRVKGDYYGLVRIGYYSGLSAYYYTLKENTNYQTNSTINYFALQKTATDMIKWDVGFTFAF
jgi:hypothetical protein